MNLYLYVYGVFFSLFVCACMSIFLFVSGFLCVHVYVCVFFVYLSFAKVVSHFSWGVWGSGLPLYSRMDEPMALSLGEEAQEPDEPDASHALPLEPDFHLPMVSKLDECLPPCTTVADTVIQVEWGSTDLSLCSTDHRVERK